MHPYLQRALSSFSPKGSLKNFVEAKQYLALCTTLKEPDISQEEKRVAYILLVYCYLTWIFHHDSYIAHLTKLYTVFQARLASFGHVLLVHSLAALTCTLSKTEWGCARARKPRVYKAYAKNEQ
jgi:hypothetical protein